MNTGSTGVAGSARGGSTPRLYLVTPPLQGSDAERARLEALVSGGAFAAVLLRLARADERALVNRGKMFAPLVQGAGAALLIEHEALVGRVGADGVHVTGADAAGDITKGDRILGVGGLTARHDAMVAGESGADYVMFGEPDADGAREAFAAALDRVAWWAEMFEIPCVGFAGSRDELAELGRAGPEFIALGDLLWSAEDAGAALRAVQDQLGAMEAA